MSTPALAVLSLTRSLEGVTSDLRNLAVISGKMQLTPVQKSRAKLLI